MYLPVGVGGRSTRKQIGLLNGITCVDPVGVNCTLIQCRPTDKSGNIDPVEPT